MGVPLVDGRIEIALSSVLVVAGAFAIVAAQSIRAGSIPDPIGSGGFAVLCGVVLIVIGLLQVAQQVTQIRRSGSHLVPCAGAEADEAGYPASTLRAFAMLGSGFAWVVLAPVIGFLGATLALGVAVIRFMGVTESVKVVAVPAITVALMWIVFDRMFGIALPQGPIEAFLQDLLPNIRIGG